MQRFIEKAAEYVGGLVGEVVGTIAAMRVQRHFNMAALTPFIHERIAHYEKARRIMRDTGMPEAWIDDLIDLRKNEAA